MKLSEYTYYLPPERIASHPLADRDASRLLFYKGGKIEHHTFREIGELLENKATLFLNNTKVIPARLYFRRPTGALIEIFLLEPVLPSKDIATAMTCTETVTWKCLIGNLKKWKEGETLTLKIETERESVTIQARISDRTNGIIRLDWDVKIPFSALVELIGKMPLPPYIKREADPEDHERYQTVYHQQAGAVAAPTAGLHFTEELLAAIQQKGIHCEYLTLHVSAGTFMPIKDENISTHRMHAEQVYVTRENIERVIASDQVIAVGTTSMRTLESLYWYGARLISGAGTDFAIAQDTPYLETWTNLPSRREAFNAILDHMDAKGIMAFSGMTEIFIFPGYTFRVCDGIITNFHLPGSTLILLVAAFVGEDWKRIYQEAMDNDYRFLSYGDSSFLQPGDQGADI